MKKLSPEEMARALTNAEVVRIADCHTCHADKGEPCRWWTADRGVHVTRAVHAAVLIQASHDKD